MRRLERRSARAVLLGPVDLILTGEHELVLFSRRQDLAILVLFAEVGADVGRLRQLLGRQGVGELLLAREELLLELGLHLDGGLEPTNLRRLLSTELLADHDLRLELGTLSLHLFDDERVDRRIDDCCLLGDQVVLIHAEDGAGCDRALFRLVTLPVQVRGLDLAQALVDLYGGQLVDLAAVVADRLSEREVHQNQKQVNHGSSENWY